MKVPRTIFREYDIRGIVGDEIDSQFSYALGRGFGSYLAARGKKTVVAAGDNRKSTPEFKKNLVDGLLSSGCDVCDIGITPTPILYFVRATEGFDAGVMVTASHNPPQFNGFKLVVNDTSLHGPQITEIADIIEGERFINGRGNFAERNFDEAYLAFMRKKFSFSRKWRIGVDTGNGTTGPIVKELFTIPGIEFHGLYLESDSSFPHHMPDPVVPENMKDLTALVKRENLDAGFGFDGDGDRIGVIAEDGAILWGDRLLIIYAAALLKEKQGATVVFDVKCTRALEEEIRKHGGNPIMWKTGHSLIEDKLRESGGLIAGELSGHIYFADEYFGYDDALYAALRLLKIMDSTGLKPGQLLAGVRQYPSSPEIRIDVGEEAKYRIVDQIKKFYKGKYPVLEIDGVRVSFPAGWALVRVSNTQPAIVVRIEGDTQTDLEMIREEFLRKIQEVSE
jgi:phosphomannomutase/phosphoglucomutase